MKALYKLAKKPFFGRFMIPWRNPLSEAEQKTWETFKIKSKTKAIIQCMLGRANTDAPKGIVVLGHPMRKEAKGFFLKNGYTELLRNNGFHTLLFDINGFGESSIGDFNYHKDIIAAGNAAKEKFPDLPLGYFGVSMSGQFSAITFAHKHPFQFAIIESAANLLEDFWKAYPLAFKILKAMYFINPRFKRKARMIDRIKEAHSLQQILFIYVENDELLPKGSGQKYTKACGVPSKLVVFKNAAHAAIAKSSDKTAYFYLILNFLNAQSKQASA